MITIFTDLDFEPHALYHVSPKLFDFPSREEIEKAREWSPSHSNGILGLWCSTFPETCASFGKYVYRISMKPDARVIGVPYTPFRRLTSDMADFTDLVAFLSEQGDIVYIVDATPHIGEVIILNMDAIDRFENVSDHDPRNKKLTLNTEQGAGNRNPSW